MEISIEDILKKLNPENELETKIITNENFIIGCNYGEPRKGHPEGKVIYHILEVLRNVEKYSLPNNKDDLRLIGLIHDTFKFKVDRSKPKYGENHHGMLARRFAEGFNLNKGVLDIIELHDEAYLSWYSGNKTQNWNIAKERAQRLIQRLNNNLELYLTFYKCDNETGNKERENFNWFKGLIGIRD
jgi:hypothetical protein